MKLSVLLCTILFTSIPSAAAAQTVVPAQPRVVVPEAPFTVTFGGILVTEGDIADRQYIELGTVSAKKGKLSLVSKSPTREGVAEKFAKAARKLGADAVVRAHYGSAGVSFGSWGDLKGEGVAIKYK